jgi:hypothetical protein
LARKARRSASSLSYYLQKTYQRIVTLKVSTILLATIAIAASVFLLGGGIYDLLERPIIAFVSGGRPIIYYPQALNEQLLGESIAAMILYAIFRGHVNRLIAYMEESCSAILRKFADAQPAGR